MKWRTDTLRLVEDGSAITRRTVEESHRVTYGAAVRRLDDLWIFGLLERHKVSHIWHYTITDQGRETLRLAAAMCAA